MNYQVTHYVSVDESMDPYFGIHGAKPYIHSKPINFGFKLWVMAIPWGYCIQFHPYAGKDSILQEYENIGLGLGASVVAKLLSKLCVIQTYKYHIAMENFFTSPALLRHLSLSAMGVAATGTLKTNQMENAPFWDYVKMNKEKVDHQMWLLLCPWISLQYLGKIVMLRMRFPPLLLNNQFNRWNIIFIVKNGVWKLIIWAILYRPI